jgi:hypothetical protein
MEELNTIKSIYIEDAIQDIIDIIQASKDIKALIGAENISANNKSGYVIFYPTTESIEQPQFSGPFIYDGYEIDVRLWRNVTVECKVQNGSIRDTEAMISDVIIATSYISNVTTGEVVWTSQVEPALTKHSQSAILSLNIYLPVISSISEQIEIENSINNSLYIDGIIEEEPIIYNEDLEIPPKFNLG